MVWLLQIALALAGPDKRHVSVYIQCGTVLLAGGHPPHGEDSKSRNAGDTDMKRQKPITLALGSLPQDFL